MKREEGYYWVLILGDWDIAYYDVDCRWYLCGRDKPMLEIDLLEIDERRLKKN